MAAGFFRFLDGLAKGAVQAAGVGEPLLARLFPIGSTDASSSSISHCFLLLVGRRTKALVKAAGMGVEEVEGGEGGEVGGKESPSIYGGVRLVTVDRYSISAPRPSVRTPSESPPRSVESSYTYSGCYPRKSGASRSAHGN